jgi:cytoskeleton protein RodZ
MEKLCLQCQQKLSFSKAVRGELFCSSDHRELYLQAEARLTIERVTQFDIPSRIEKPEPQARPAPESPPLQVTAPPAVEPAPVEPVLPKVVSISTARNPIRIWLASGIAACLALVTLGALFFGPSRNNAHSLLPPAVQPLSAAEQGANIAKAQVEPPQLPVVPSLSVADPKTQSSGPEVAPPALPVAAKVLPPRVPAKIPAPASEPVNATVSKLGTRHAATIRAAQASWVAACSDGKEVLSRSLANGDTREIEFSQKMVVRTGNAGGTEISVDGRPIGSIGPAGALRIVELGPQGFHLLSLEPGDNGHDCRNN